MQIYSCRHCTDRKPGCHDTCEKYQAERKKAFEEKRVIYEAKKKQAMATEYTIKSIKRMKGGKK
jgi:hypothetical protein